MDPSKGRAPKAFPRTRWLPYVLSVVCIVLLGFALYYIGLADKRVAAAVPFLFAVFLVALAWGQAPAIVAAVASSVMFNYLIVPPPNAFSVPTIEEIVLFIGLLGVACGLGMVTDRMHAVREEAKELAASERLQKTLLNCISHDLRTPLTAVMGSLSTLLAEGDQLDETVRQELIGIAYAGTKRLDRLMAQVLEMTRLEAGAVQLRREPGHLANVVRTAATQLHEGLNGRCQVQLADDLPAIPMDSTLLSHALTNILDNAAKYSLPDAPIEVEAYQNRQRVVVSIADRGVGVPPGDLDRIFGKFYRLRHTNTARGVVDGSGLGLAIAKGIVEAHGGRIWAEQREGGGTVVKLSLPLG